MTKEIFLLLVIIMINGAGAFGLYLAWKKKKR